MGQFTALYYICSVSGFCMIVGGMWLIYKEKIYLDPKTKAILNVDVPFFGKIRTNIPALGLFLLGFFPLIYPILKSRPQYLLVHQPSVKSNLHPVAVYLVVHTEVLQQDNELNLSVPILPIEDYRPELIYVAGAGSVAGIVQEQGLNLKLAKSGELILQSKEIQAPNAGGVVKPQPVQPDIQPKPAEFR